MSNPRIYLASPHMCGKEMQYIQQAFDTNWIAPLGGNVTGFEEAMEKYTSYEYALALSSGTAALHLALKLCGVKSGDKVFCQSLTFSASCNPIIYENATPVFIDSEQTTWNMDPDALIKAIQEYGIPQALIAVDLYGTPCQSHRIAEICKEYHIAFIEDAAEALGSTMNGQHVGTIADYAVLSFNGNKIITTSGGGALLVHRKEEKEKALFWATQAREKKPWYEHKELGYNYRLSNICAGIGRGQLSALEDRVQKKREILTRYKEGFEEIKEISIKKEEEGARANNWLSTILISDDSSISPMDIVNRLEEENIEARPIWKPMNIQPFYKNYPFVQIASTPVCERIFNRGVCLPSDTKMTDEQQKRIIKLIEDMF